MKITKELLKKMDEDDKTELGDLTPNEEASYQEMETYLIKASADSRLPRSSWGRSSPFPKGSLQLMWDLNRRA